MELRRTLALGASALVLVACGESHTPGEDAAIVFDASFPDTGTDAGPPPSNVGAACGSDADCSGAADTCLSQGMSGLPGGYCTAYCATDEDCPADSACVPVGMGTSVCLASCDPGGTDQCRSGYGCSATGAPVCLPGCEDDTDCGSGMVCELGGGFYDAGGCRNPSAEIGDACVTEEQCAPGDACLSERFNEWPGGACVGTSCDPVANTGCEGDAVCAATTSGGGLCVDGCETDADCRAAYRCRALGDDPTRLACLPGCTMDSQCTATFGGGGLRYVCNPGTGYCTRPLNPDELGEPCSGGFRECRGGRCLTEDGSGWPAGMCTYPGCSLSGAEPSATCPTGSVCTDDDAGDADLGVCVPGCTVDASTCRPGYACVPLADGETEGACRPACTSDSCSAGNTCNTETGLCE